MLDHDHDNTDKKEVTDLNIGGSEDIVDVDAPGDNDKQEINTNLLDMPNEDASSEYATQIVDAEQKLEVEEPLDDTAEQVKKDDQEEKEGDKGEEQKSKESDEEMIVLKKNTLRDKMQTLKYKQGEEIDDDGDGLVEEDLDENEIPKETSQKSNG